MNDNRTGIPKAITEFLSEAQEFVEELSGVLMDIDGELRQDDEVDPDHINEAFRCWHTLKGLSATFGAESLAHLAHREETLLHDIRLGRKPLDAAVLDRLLSSVDVVMGALSRIKETGDLTGVELPGDQSVAPDAAAPTAPEPIKGPELRDLVPGDILEVLTEFEEHRLVTNIDKGRSLYKVRAAFNLASIDTELETIKGALKPLGEIITYLPCDDSESPDKLDIEVLVGLKKEVVDLEGVAADFNASLSLLFDGSGRTAVSAGPATAASEPALPPGDASVRQSLAPAQVAHDAALAADGGEKAISLRSVSQTVRVDISKLDHLMNAVGELGLVRSSITRVSDELRTVVGRRDLAIELHRIIRGFDRRLAEIREGILEVRMVPLSQMFDRLARVIRKVSRNLGKEIQFVVSGAETEVDKLIIEELSDPLMHIIRNAIDHGIETREERMMLGKPEYGTVALTAYQKGNHVLTEIEDDGAGIDGERLLQVAVERGVISAEQAQVMGPREMLNLIFLPGISTAAEATEISGRGVGMDVVKTNISALGGIVEVQSEIGIGTKFTITMPVTLAITPALLVSVNEVTYAVPLNTVAEAFMLRQSDLRRVMNSETMTLRGQTLPLCRLDAFFNIYRPGPIMEGSRVVIAELGQRRVGLVVDALVGQQDVIIKSLGPSMARSGCFSGVTDIGDQRLALVLDTVAIIEEFFATTDEGSQYAG